MSKRTINLEDELPTHGEWFPVRIDRSEEKEGPKGPYINWMMVITDGEFTGSPIWHITSLSTPFKVRQLYEACGLPIPKRNEEHDIEGDLQGKQFLALIKHESMDKSDPSARVSAKIDDQKPLV